MSDAPPGLMTLFREALEQADPANRAAYLDRACGADADLRDRVEALLASHARAGRLREPDADATVDPDNSLITGAGVPQSDWATGTLPGPSPIGGIGAPHWDGSTGTLPGPPPIGGIGAAYSDEATRTWSDSSRAEGDSSATGQPIIGGRYTLNKLIGEGGMGSVYLASQTEPVKRQVALKLIKMGMDSKGVLARFDAERQALALMDHPNIARIYDGGVTPGGQPFFVMELVQGVPLTEYCDTKRLSVNARLQLFVAVCQAVQHAHQKGIIHRDLKPGNVLVTEVDGRPTPKVIDFGVAKATEQKLTEMSFFDVGAIVGTPAYMSPEQADPTSMDIDTRTDVYALGVMLYELLTGSPPIDSMQFTRGAILEMLRMVREVEPPRPSTKLSTADALANIAANRNIEPAKLAKLLQGELDWVVMKALEKERTRRYETANGLARDIQRYLADEVVEARPPSRGYRLKKFVKRNKGQVIAASLVLLTLVGGVIGTTLGMVKAREQRGIAEENLRKSDENFLLAEQNQRKSEENYQLARAAVDRYLTQVGDSRLLNEPYMDELRLELLRSAREFYQAFADRRRDDPAAARDLAVAHVKLADIEWRMGKNESAIEALEISRKAMLAADPAANTQVQYIQSGVRLCSYQLQLGRLDHALSTANRTLSEVETGLKVKSDDPQIANLFARVLERRGAIFRQMNQKSEAIADFTQAADTLERLERQRPEVREHSRDLSNIYVHRGQMAYQMQDNDEAESWHRKSLTIRRKLADAEPRSEAAKDGLAVALSNVAATLRRRNRYAEAIPMMQEAVDIYRRLVREHPGVASFQSSLASYLSNLSVIYKTSGAAEKAEPLNKEAIQVHVGITKQFPTVTHYVLGLGMAEGNEGNSYLDAKGWDDAIVWFDRSNATLEPLLKKSNDPSVRTVLRNNHWGRADALMAQRKFADAIAAYDSAIALAEDRNRTELRLARALALAKSGDHKAAVAVVDAETAVTTAGSFVWFDSSKVLVAAAAATMGNLQTVEELQARAVVALRRAFELKYFRDARKREELQSPAFAPLRNREDFQKLVTEIAAKSPRPKEAAPPPQEKK